MSSWVSHADGMSSNLVIFLVLIPTGEGVCRGNPEGVGAALPTSPDRAMLGSQGRAEVKPQVQHVSVESDTVMQDVKQERKVHPPVKPQVSG